MDFESLVGHINQVQDVLQAQAAHAVNLSLTARNWLVGYYIVEFEQNGEDRAKYGDKLINRLAKEINRKGFEPRSLRLYRRIYLVYPQLGTEIGAYLHNNSLGIPDASGNSIWQSMTAKLQTSENQSNEIWQSAIAKLEEWSTPADWLFNKLNYTSLAYLTSIEEPLKRAFYEQETIRGCWTSRELYMNYYKHEVMQADDNPPIGLLLCTDYGVTTVQYATEGLSQNLFVSKYRLQLPSEDDIKQYLLENISEEKFKELKEEEENENML